MSAAETYDAPQALPLHRLDAEQALLGALIFDNGHLEQAGSLRAEHFYDPVHQRIFAAIRTLNAQGRVADGVTLKAFFAADHGIQQIGGAAYLMKLMDAAAPLSSQVRSYAELIRDLAQRRRLSAAVDGVLDRLAAHDADADEIRLALEAQLHDIAADAPDADAWEELGAITRESVARAKAGEARGISTGIDELDEITGGLQPATLWSLAGTRSMGKSIIGSALSRNIAAQGFGVGEIHLEMDRLQIGLRTASALAFVRDPKRGADNPHYLSAMRGELSAHQWERMEAGAASSERLPIFVDARPGRTLRQIEAAARRMFAQMRRKGITPGALLIDHEGLIAPEPGEKHPSQLERAFARAEGLLALAKRLGVTVIALAQITKEGARRDGEESLPSVDDIKYGGAFADAAQVAILIHRKAYYAARKPESLRSIEDWDAIKSRECLLIVDKARGGRRGQVKVFMDAPTAALFDGETLI